MDLALINESAVQETGAGLCGGGSSSGPPGRTGQHTRVALTAQHKLHNQPGPAPSPLECGSSQRQQQTHPGLCHPRMAHPAALSHQQEEGGDRQASQTLGLGMLSWDKVQMPLCPRGPEAV